MGVVLTPAELRNAIASAIGSLINMVVETNDFFLHSRIPKQRYRQQDFLAHALALSIYNNSDDLKAALLTRLYQSYPTRYDQSVARRVSEVLEWLHKINQSASSRIYTKWGFVDLFWFLWRHIDSIQTIDVPGFAKAYVDFEDARQKHSAKPEILLTRRPQNRSLYNYIQAFKTAGALTANIEKRQRVIERWFQKYLTKRS